MEAPVIKIEIQGSDVVAVGETLVSLASTLSPNGGTTANIEMPFDELLAIVRARAKEQGFKLIVVRAEGDDDGDGEDKAPAQDYEPKAVVRRKRRTKAEMEAARAAEAAPAEPEPEAEQEEEAVEDMPLAAAAEEPEEEELSEEELEQIKRQTMRRLMPIYNEKNGQARVAEILKDYNKKYASVATIPAKYFPEIAKRIDP